MMTLSWKTGRVLLGLVFFAAVLLVKPIGVSTQFVILDGVLWDAVDPTVVVESVDAKSGYASTSAYLDKSGGKYAKSVANPLNYSFIFVLAMVIGAAVSSWMNGGLDRAERSIPAIWRANYGDSRWQRYAVAFAGGFIVLYGARLAGGCTSGHMMSGVMQTAISGYLFTIGAFAAAIPVAMMMYRKEV
jgi:hypothetical protein